MCYLELRGGLFRILVEAVSGSELFEQLACHGAEQDAREVICGP